MAMTAARPHVLIGFAEAVAAVESAWSLQAAGFEVVAFARAGRPSALARARGVRIVTVPSPEADSAGCVAAVEGLLDALRPAAVLPLDDSAVWVTDRAVRAPGSVAVLAGPAGGHAALALDKALQADAASAAGLRVPRTVTVTPGDGTAVPPGPGPWVVRPAPAVVDRRGRLEKPAVAVVSTPEDVSAHVDAVGVSCLVQPVVLGAGEGVFAFAGARGVTAVSAHRRVRMVDPRGSGSSASRSIAVDAGLEASVRRFLERVGWRGPAMVELLRDDEGTPWFVELNGRMWGSIALARRRGFEYPAWAVRAALEPDFAPSPPIPEPDHITCRHLGGELVHLAAVLQGPRRGDDPRPWPSRTRTLRDVLVPRRGDRWYNARRGQVRVLVADTRIVLAQRIASLRAASRSRPGGEGP